MVRLRGKTAVVTGAGAGIGLATVQRFVEEGAQVVAADVDPARLQEFEGNPAVATIVANVADRDAVERMIGLATERFGRLDILVNNAGIMDDFVPVGEVSDELWNRVLAVNLTGPMMTSRAALPIMLQQGGGVILNVSSIGGLEGGLAGAAYTASKHGLIGLTRNTAANYGRDGIRCVAVCPGGVSTRIGENMHPNPRGWATIEKVMAANLRSADPKELAAVILFLVSDEASFVNGAVLVADGGFTAY